MPWCCAGEMLNHSELSQSSLLLLGDSFEADLLNEACSPLGQLNMDELQMLSDPSIITDTATEDLFRLDRL